MINRHDVAEMFVWKLEKISLFCKIVLIKFIQSYTLMKKLDGGVCVPAVLTALPCHAGGVFLFFYFF